MKGFAQSSDPLPKVGLVYADKVAESGGNP
jgi:hypothetical protein